jgi:hypothetical protein
MSRRTGRVQRFLFAANTAVQLRQQLRHDEYGKRRSTRGAPVQMRVELTPACC